MVPNNRYQGGERGIYKNGKLEISGVQKRYGLSSQVKEENVNVINHSQGLHADVDV